MPNLTRASSYKADYDGKQGEPYVRAKGKCKSQLDFASRFAAHIRAINAFPSSEHNRVTLPPRNFVIVIIGAAMSAVLCRHIKRCSRTTIASATYAVHRPHFSLQSPALIPPQVDDVQRFGDKGTFFTGHDILDHGHRRKPQTFDG